MADTAEGAQYLTVKIPDPTVASKEFVQRLCTLGREGWSIVEAIPQQVGRSRMNLQVFLSMPKQRGGEPEATYEYKVERLWYDVEACNRDIRVHTHGGWRLVKAMAGGHNGRFLYGIYEKRTEQKPREQTKRAVTRKAAAGHSVAAPSPEASLTAAANAF